MRGESGSSVGLGPSGLTPGSQPASSGTLAPTVPGPSRPGDSEDPTTIGAGLLTVLLTLAGWTAVPLFLRHFSYSIDAWTSNGWRYGFSAFLWLPLVIACASRRTLPARIWRAALIPSLFNCAGQICFTWGHYRIDPGLLTFGLRLQIVFVAIGAAVLFASERRVVRSPGFIIGIVLVFGGTVGTVVLGEGLGEAATMSGVTLAGAAGLFFACYGLSVRYFLHGMSPMVAFAVISQYTAIGMVGLMLALGDQMGATALSLPGDQFLLLLFSAVIGIALGHVFYYISIAKLGVAVSSGIIQLQPFTVGVASYFLFQEVLTGLQWLSGSLAVLGAAIILWVQHRVTRRARHAKRQAAEVAAAEERARGASSVESSEAGPVGGDTEPVSPARR